MFRPLISALALIVLTGGASYAEEFEVRMLNKNGDDRMVFEPDFLQIAAGDTVHFIPTDKGHNAESITGMAPEDSTPFQGKIGKQVDVTFDTEGVYGVECKPHFAMGMVMTIAVGDVSAPDDFLAGRIPPKAKARFEAQLGSL
ncbi:pseudoazurin [Celeribacter baekdonensis]|uniref:pseudoazurin n=1 Tax=Celeribacter baekdonensis TaxID=875171 RepID=UPI003A8DE123